MDSIPRQAEACQTTRDWVPFFERVKRAAVLGAGPPGASPGWQTALLLHANGIEVYVVESGGKDRALVKCVSRLEEIPGTIDLVDCFPEGGKAPEEAIREAVSRGVGSIWLEPGIRLGPETEAILEASGVQAVRGLSLRAEFLSCYACA